MIRSSAAILGGALLIVSLLGWPGAAQAHVVERASVATGGTQGNDWTSYCSISGDGRYLVFGSYSTNLVPGDTNGTSDIFVRDRQTGSTERVSVAGDGTQANESSYGPSISADGRYVAFPSDASNLVPGDTNDRRDAFVRDRQAETTALVSVSSTGTKGNLSSGTRSISADGRYVAFISYATNLVPGDTNWVDDVFVRDLQTGTTERVSVSAGGNQANRGSILTAAISADGRFVAFESEASNLVSGDTNGVYDVFVAEITPAGFFSDVSSSPYRIAIEGLAQAGVVSGYGDRTFRPLNPVLRAQFAKMIVLGLSLTVTEGGTSLPFSDVPKPSNDLYPDDYVAVAAANGLVEGYGGGIFKPYIDIARAQVLTMVVRAAERFKPAAVPEPPSDWHGVLPTTDATHGKNIARAEYGGLLAGIDLSGFSLYGKATRGEVAQIVWNLRQK